MDYEKRYKEAIERMKSWAKGEHPECFSEAQKTAEFIFPELKENEDEKIRKELIAIYSVGAKVNAKTGDIYDKDIVAWLEKQGEQPTDKIDTKFNVGDWIVDDKIPNDVFCVIEVLGEIYKVIDIDDDDYHIPHCKADKQFHLWTIQDAKDGDVLVDSYSKDSIIILYKGIYKERTILAHCGWNGYNLSVNTNGFGYGGLDNTNYLPATKEQCDLLFQKIKEEGYEWDTKRKELKKIEQKPVDKVGPKFKVGNWYQCTKDFFGKGVTFDKNTAYYCANEGCLQNEYGCHIAIVKDLYDNFKLWTIQDAEDGDVLLEEETGEPFIYNGNRATHFLGYFLGAHCGIYNGEFNPLGNNYCWGKNSCPATNEQRDLLFQKMKDAGYEWDAERKGLKKIES